MKIRRIVGTTASPGSGHGGKILEGFFRECGACLLFGMIVLLHLYVSNKISFDSTFNLLNLTIHNFIMI